MVAFHDRFSDNIRTKLFNYPEFSYQDLVKRIDMLDGRIDDAGHYENFS